MAISDPFSGCVALFMRGNGADGFLDEGPWRATPENLATTTASKSTAEKKFGDASLYFSGAASSELRMPFVPPIGPKDFTLSVWVRPRAGSLLYPTIVRSAATWGGDELSLNYNHAAAPGKFTFFVAGYAGVLLTSASTVVMDRWTHLEVSRSGSVWALFVDGVREATREWTGSVASGGAKTYQLGLECQCYIDDLVLSIGVARHADAFTPAQYEIDPVAVVSRNALNREFFRTLEPLRNKHLSSLTRLVDIENGGKGRIQGTVKVVGAPDNRPLRRRVYLLRNDDMKLVAITESNTTTGEYLFDAVREDRKYVVLTTDYEGDYAPVAVDKLTLEPMP